MAAQDMAAILNFFVVSKRVCMYLGRVLPQRTVDLLMYELIKLIEEEDDRADESRSPASTSQVHCCVQ